MGVGIALRREILVHRHRLAVAPAVNFNVSRREPVGEITHGWAAVALWNRGGRALSVEHAGFTFFTTEEVAGAIGLIDHRAEIGIKEPIELPVDGPTRKVYTPLGPLLAAGVDPFGSIQAFAITTGGREWYSPIQPLIQSVSDPPTTAKKLTEGLDRLRDSAESPPRFGRLISLNPEQPYLPDE